MTRQDAVNGVKFPNFCAIAVMECNVDQKYLNSSDYSSAIDECKREPCRCESER